ncbi:RNA polymerase sigma factor [Marinicrinis lubricantis]|uniref:RNA polymerase sigma factor n=1 Tax=Marinicrinis lubricantis TaxID=2086470 RepID=A0ABW1IVK8_9BACL
MTAMTKYENLVIPHLHELRNYCCYLTRSKWDGDDLYQETLLKTFKYYKSEGTIRETRAFLFRVARNLWIDQYRKEHKLQTAVEQQEVVQESYTSPDYVQIRSIVEALLAHMPERYLEMWLLSSYFGYSMQEIAQMHHCTVSAVKSVLHRTRETIRSLKGDALEHTGKVISFPVDRWVRAVAYHQPRYICR